MALLTTEQIIARTGYHKNSLYRFRVQGVFPEPMKRGAHGRCFYDSKDIARFFAKHDGTGARGPIARNNKR